MNIDWASCSLFITTADMPQDFLKMLLRLGGDRLRISLKCCRASKNSTRQIGRQKTHSVKTKTSSAEGQIATWFP